MPSAMTLTLKLNGVTAMVTAIRRLNTAVGLLNKNFNLAARGIQNTAAAMKSINSSSKQMLKPPVINPSMMKGSRSSGSGSSYKNLFNNPIHDWFTSNNSILYSLFSGGVGSKRFKAKVGVRALGSMFNNHSNGAPPVIGSLSEIAGKLGKVFTIATLAIFASIEYIKMWGEAIKWAAGIVKDKANLFWGSGGNAGKAGQLAGVAKALNLPYSQVSGDAASQPGMSTGMVARLKALWDMSSDEQAAHAAQQMGLSNYLPIRDLKAAGASKNDVFGSDTNGMDPKSRQASAKLDFALGHLKHAWDDLAVSMTPLIEYAAKVLRVIQAIIDALSRLGQFLINIYKLIMNILGVPTSDAKTAQEGMNAAMRNAAAALGNAADKFTGKVGTFGGGEKAQNAIPKGLTQYTNQRRLINLADNLGAFQF